MSTSGNTSWELQSTALVNSAYRKLGYLSEGQVLSTEAYNNGLEALNMVVSLLTTMGMPLWKRSQLSFTPQSTTQSFNVPNAVKIPQVVLTFTNGTRYPLIEKSRYDFNMLPPNAGPGVPVHYEIRTINPMTGGMTVNIWPTTADSSTIANATVTVWYQKIFDGMFNTTDTLDFPAYWTLGIVLKTAEILAPEAGMPIPDRASISKQAADAIKMAADYGDEDGSLYLQPDFIGHW